MLIIAGVSLQPIRDRKRVREVAANPSVQMSSQPVHKAQAQRAWLGRDLFTYLRQSGGIFYPISEFKNFVFPLPASQPQLSHVRNLE